MTKKFFSSSAEFLREYINVIDFGMTKDQVSAWINQIFTAATNKPVVKTEQKNNRMLRFWWFFSFGYLLVSLITGLFLYTVYFIIPLLLVLWKRKKVLRYLFIVSFLPQAEMVWLKSKEDRIEVVSKYDHLSSAEREYLAFNKPKFLTNLIAWIFILLSPIMLVLQIVPISLFMMAKKSLINIQH